MVQRTVQLGLSFEAMDTSKANKRVGVFLILPVKKGVKSAMDQELENIPMDEKMGKISDLLDYAKSMVEPIIHQKYQQNEYMDGMIMSVLTGYGGQGIATRLLNAVEGLTKELKLNLIYVGCTSKYSSLVMAKSGYEVAYSLRYDEYIKDGVQVFKPEPPHDTMSAYIKLLD